MQSLSCGGITGVRSQYITVSEGDYPLAAERTSRRWWTAGATRLMVETSVGSCGSALCFEGGAGLLGWRRVSRGDGSVAFHVITRLLNFWLDAWYKFNFFTGHRESENDRDSAHSLRPKDQISKEFGQEFLPVAFYSKVSGKLIPDAVLALIIYSYFGRSKLIIFLTISRIPKILPINGFNLLLFGPWRAFLEFLITSSLPMQFKFCTCQSQRSRKSLKSTIKEK